MAETTDIVSAGLMVFFSVDEMVMKSVVLRVVEMVHFSVFWRADS